MWYLIDALWFPIGLAACLGLAVGAWTCGGKKEPGSSFSLPMQLALLALVACLVLVLTRALIGRPSLWAEMGLLLAGGYIVGCCCGCMVTRWLGGEIMRPVAAAAVAASGGGAAIAAGTGRDDASRSRVAASAVGRGIAANGTHTSHIEANQRAEAARLEADARKDPDTLGPYARKMAGRVAVDLGSAATTPPAVLQAVAPQAAARGPMVQAITAGLKPEMLQQPVAASAGFIGLAAAAAAGGKAGEWPSLARAQAIIPAGPIEVAAAAPTTSLGAVDGNSGSPTDWVARAAGAAASLAAGPLAAGPARAGLAPGAGAATAAGAALGGSSTDALVASAATENNPLLLTGPRGGTGDDLTLIWGVADKLAARMNTMGIWHFDQIAAWTPKHVAWFEDKVPGFKGRLNRDQWVDQCKKLATGWRPGTDAGQRRPT